ncbi:unnamed protein product [Rotaria socialis]|uniref:Cyclic nucleotide-binding domain-containing protein n=1 Tax=Rotaria socialis TaxID=392032 RepID=A0A818A4X7_9BILA|nr:unnamed protein product [Rotaria socialis]CAF4375816.1 unnamed protein product [Rotaria socialis]
MESPKSGSSTETQESKLLQSSDLPTPKPKPNRTKSFQSTVLRTQRLMSILKTMNTVGEIKRTSYIESNASESAQYQRRGAKTLEKATSDESSETSSILPALNQTGKANEAIASSRLIGQRFIILHYSPFKAVWDWVVILLVLYTGIITPYTISFLSDDDQKRTTLNQYASTRRFNRERTSIQALVIIDVLVDFMFIFDILISFRTTFVLKETNEVITNPILIAKHFVIDSWRRFAADILGALPWDILFFGNGSHWTIRLANCFKLARLLRLVAFVRNFQKTEYRSAVLFLLMLLFAIAAHWLACIFHFIAILERPNLQVKYSWLDHLADKYKMPYLVNDTLSGPDTKSKYLTALFFAMTSLTSVGFGNVAANTNGEKLFSILSMLAGSFLSASILGSVTTIIIKLYQGAEELKEMKQSIDDFIKHHRISRQLAKQMQESFDHEWKNTKGIDMNSVLKTFPECIQADICLHLNRELLNNCAVFEDASEVTLRALALLFKSTHVPPGDTLIHQGDVLYSVYFIRGGQMEVVQDHESQAILGRNDILGENPCDTTTPGKSQCIVRGVTYCTLNKIHRDDLLHVFELYPDFAKSFAERFRVTFDLRQCKLIEPKPFYKLDDDIQTLIRQRRPKLQTERELSIISEGEEATRLAALQLYRGVHTSIDDVTRRRISTIVELSPDQAHPSAEELDYSKKQPRMSLTPLTRGTLTRVLSTIAEMPKTAKTNVLNMQDSVEEKLSITTETHFVTDKPKPILKYEIAPVRSMADVDAELSFLQSRFDSLERTMENKMKLLLEFANAVQLVLVIFYKDEATTVSGQSTVTTSVINLKTLPPTSSQATETLHHHHQTYRKAAIGKSTLNKTDEHCRSLFNLLPISLRPRQLHQTSNNKGVGASTTTQISQSIDVLGADYDSGYMSQSVLNRTPSYTSCYSAVATTVPVPTTNRHGSIESLLHGHSKSNPAHIRVLIRKNFESFAQAHISVTKGTIATALFARGPWLYIRLESNGGQTGYIPRIICSLYKNRIVSDEKKNHYQTNRHYHLSLSSTDSVSNKEDELDLTVLPIPNDAYYMYTYKQKKEQQMNRYLSHSSNVINDEPKSKEYSNKRSVQTNLIGRERRNTCTLVPPLINLSRDRRLTVNPINWPIQTTNCELVGIHQINDISTVNNNVTIPPPPPPQRDTDSSSTQDSGYSESASYFLVQQATSDTEQISTVTNTPKKSTSSPHYATVRHATRLKIPDTTNTHHSSLRRNQQQTAQSTRPLQYRHTLVNGLPINTMLANNLSKRHSFGAFYINDNKNYDHSSTKSVNTITNGFHTRSNDYTVIRNARREKTDLYQQTKPSIHNLPESYQQIPASIFLHHHRQQQKQQFGSSHSAFRPVQPTTKSKRASSEGHSPSRERHSPSRERQITSPAISISSSSLSSSASSSSNLKRMCLLKQRRLSCDISIIPMIPHTNSKSLTRSVCDQTSTKKLNNCSRTMSEILCDQFSEINLDAIEQDSLTQLQTNKNEQTMNKTVNIQQNLYTITKDYRSSRASFSVKCGDCVHVIKQVGRACYLVRKQTNGQIGFLPKALVVPTTTNKVDTFLEMHGYRETII